MGKYTDDDKRTMPTCYYNTVTTHTKCYYDMAKTHTKAVNLLKNKGAKLEV